MINKLIIQNVALIEEAEIDFCAGLNILSGETGAGKSVILDSVNFVLGAKADKSMIRYGEKQCAVFAEFSISGNEQVKAILDELEIETEDDLLLIGRKFSMDGKSSIKINGMPANAAMLRRITSCLVDVHGQSEHFFLLKESNQLKVLDNVIGEPLYPWKEKLKNAIKQFKDSRERLEQFGMDESERSRRLDILSFQIDEITSADLKEGEEEELISKRNKMNSVEKVMNALQEAQQILQADGSGIDSIRQANHTLGYISNVDSEYATLCERLENLQAEAEDISDTISSLSDDLYYDEEEMERIEKRLEEWKTLKRKYGKDLPAINEFLEQAQQNYDALSNSIQEVERLTSLIEKSKDDIYKYCQKITSLRKKAASDFSTRVMEELKTLNIPSARFSIEFKDYTEADVEKATYEGLDGIEFMFSANAGEPIKPLSKIISGGEMSRFMLSIKTQLSGINGISTYIFDEIDAGISGQTAKVVAEKFAKISKNTQIIAVSHLAQIACMADKEFLIKKQEEAGKTKTYVTELDKQGRLQELIRLLGGDPESEYAGKHAEEMIISAENYKKILS